ncbi:MAG: TIGR04283 family arsenosugar biosynthesis glycosyltransferase [Defluviitaleaceae bacterium]|nr:TIGR04283 family arsenosugar biosynthesis glycosyltransferase [Defluviitaleaceae bacterium]
MLKRRLSVIIPVYNEMAVLDKLFDQLEQLKGKCEIIFVDGGSADGTPDRITKKGGRVLRSPLGGRANQMNYGAKVAKGDILWFVHADSQLPKAALAHIRRVFARGYRIGCFPIRFTDRHPFMVIHEFLSNRVRAAVMNIAFGDQAMFMERSLFEELGGFAPIPLMEDYKFSMDMKKAGHKLGLAGAKITTSARRYNANGLLRTMWQMQVLQFKFRRGDDINDIAKKYNSMKGGGR